MSKPSKRSRRLLRRPPPPPLPLRPPPAPRPRRAPKLVDGVWRFEDAKRSENAEFWRCSQNTIFCGGEYRPALGLCTNCRTLRYHQKKGRETRRDVFRLVRYNTGRGHRDSSGGSLRISYNPALFAYRKRRRYSYARVLYERVTKEDLPPHRVVVALSGSAVPVFEQLIVVNRDQTGDVQLSRVLAR